MQTAFALNYAPSYSLDDLQRFTYPELEQMYRAALTPFARGDYVDMAKRYRRHVTAALHPNRGESLREAAERYNREA